MNFQEYQDRIRVYRVLLDELVKSYNINDENSFNSNAFLINEKREAFRFWLPYQTYERGDIRIDPENNTPYWAMHSHTSIEGQELQPSLSPTIWTHCHGTTPETARQFVAEGHNPYMEGHYCIENEIIYKCLQNNTVYAPSVYPAAWEEI